MESLSGDQNIVMNPKSAEQGAAAGEHSLPCWVPVPVPAESPALCLNAALPGRGQQRSR